MSTTVLCGKRVLSNKLHRLILTLKSSNRQQHGYIILLPEIGEESPENNPLNRKNSLPDFNKITIENCRAAIAKQTYEFESTIRNIENRIETCNDDNNLANLDVFKEIVEPLEDVGGQLDSTWGLSKTLYLGNSNLMPSTSYLAIHEHAKKARAAKFNSLPIYKAMKFHLLQKINDTGPSIGKTAAKSEYDQEHLRILQKYVLEGKLNGLELDEKEKLILIQYLNKLNEQRQQFRQKIDLATKQFAHVVDRDAEEVRDLPEELLGLVSMSNSPHKGPWKLTLQPDVYSATMELCSHRTLRWNLWQAYVTRGSNQRDRELSTSLNMEEIRHSRHDIAQLLGYNSFFDMSMETKMAASAKNVTNLLEELRVVAKPKSDNEIDQLHTFAQQRGFKEDRLQMWDVPYWRRKHLNSIFQLNDTEIRKYFPYDTVLNGLFKICEQLFDITIKLNPNVQTWHKDVKFYDVFERHCSAPVAGFYLDPFRRNEFEKIASNSGFMVAIRNSNKKFNLRPLSALIFSFPMEKIEKNSICCLSFRDVRWLFHKFGHSLQHLLTRTRFSEVAGLSNVEWDAVEISGYFMQHWLQNHEVVQKISGHLESGDKMPENLARSIVESQKHFAGMDLCRELYLSTLDYELHSTKDFWLDIVKKLWPLYYSFPLEKYDAHPCSFTPIFSEEWGAAYYSHVWARMIAADVFSAFHEVRSDEKQMADIGKRYRESFLALGGSCHSSQVFRIFRGRDPSPKALLKSLGIKKTTDTTKRNVHIVDLDVK